MLVVVETPEYLRGLADGYKKKEDELEAIVEIEIDEAKIREAVSSFYQIPWEFIADTKRKRKPVFAKQVYCYLARQLTKLKWESIAINAGHSEHSWAIDAKNTVSDLMDTDSHVKNQIHHLLNKLKNDSK